MYITRQDLHVFYQQVHQNVAKQLGIENHEWKSAGELADEIQIANSVVANKLKSFIAAYESWFKVHEEIDGAGTAGKLSPEQNEKLLNAIAARDSTRQEVIDELAKL
jgi:rRNA maturation endonuclease Nob1